MLEVIRFQNSREKNQFSDSWRHEGTVWVVSDLRSKQDLRQKLLSRNEFVEENQVLRVSEFWSKMAHQLFPDIQIISAEMAQVIIKNQAKKHKKNFKPGDSQTLYNYMGQLLPILTHPEGPMRLRDWFQQNPNSFSRWGEWFTLSLYIWQFFCEEKMISQKWLAGLLINESLNKFKSPASKVIFDLNIDLRPIEAELIKKLSQMMDITVLEMYPSWREGYENTFSAYEILSQPTIKKPTKLPLNNKYIGQTKKFTTMLAEIKDSVAQTRMWLDQGVEIEKIAIIAPDIGIYWPVLSEYLNQEGIPFDREERVPLQVFPDMTFWVSSLKSNSISTDYEDLATTLFIGIKDVQINFEQFKPMFENIYDRSDFSRLERVAKEFKSDKESNDELNRDQFLVWSLNYFPKDCAHERLEVFLKHFYKDTSDRLKLSVTDWIHFLESLISQKEITISTGAPKGIKCLDLSSADGLSATHTYIMGMMDKNLRSHNENGMLKRDIISIAKELGFYLPEPDQQGLEFLARWIIEGTQVDSILSCALSDFDGSIQAPSLVWLSSSEKEEDLEKVSLPNVCRWDEIQHSGDSQKREVRLDSSELFKNKIKKIEEDMGLKDIQAQALPIQPSLSASTLEDYVQCPFIFFSKKLLKLSDLPSLDLDVDRLTQGKMIHAMAEALVNRNFKSQWSNEELNKVMEECKKKENLILADERTWTFLKNKYLNIAQRLINFENEWRELFSETNTEAVEVPFSGYLDIETGNLKKEKGENSFKIRGKIDRLDIFEDNAVVVDYKSTKGSRSQYSSWLKKGELQLLIYALAVEEGLTDFKKLNVVSSVYFIIKSWDRSIGFVQEDVDQNLYKVDPRKRNKINQESKKKLFNEFREILSNLAKRIHEGDFRPIPKDQKNCINCHWKEVCRAPHLN